MNPRHRAREAALQILYFWEVGKAAPRQAIDEFFALHGADDPPAVRAFAETLVRGTIEAQATLDPIIASHSQHWRLERLAVIDRLILRLATWELRHLPETPPAVVIDEALELARTFGTDESVRFVNGVLDGIRKTLEAPAADTSDAPGES